MDQVLLSQSIWTEVFSKEFGVGIEAVPVWAFDSQEGRGRHCVPSSGFNSSHNLGPCPITALGQRMSEEKPTWMNKERAINRNREVHKRSGRGTATEDPVTFSSQDEKMLSLDPVRFEATGPKARFSIVRGGFLLKGRRGSRERSASERERQTTECRWHMNRHSLLLRSAVPKRP